jgi:pimeloyl-ACP methyl ester carboxylesterase
MVVPPSTIWLQATFAEMATVVQVLYFDLRGNGRSDAGPANKRSLEQCAEDVHSFCEALSIVNPIVRWVIHWVAS